MVQGGLKGDVGHATIPENAESGNSQIFGNLIDNDDTLFVVNALPAWLFFGAVEHNDRRRFIVDAIFTNLSASRKLHYRCIGFGTKDELAGTVHKVQL